MQRRYLIVPGLKSSRIHVLDIKPDPCRPKLMKVLEPEMVMRRTGYSRPILRTAGRTASTSTRSEHPHGDGPTGIFIMDPESPEIRGQWKLERWPQHLLRLLVAPDYDTMITSGGERPTWWKMV